MVKSKTRTKTRKRGGYLGNYPYRPWHLGTHDDIAITYAHGCIKLPAIKVPKNVNIITFSDVDVNFPLSSQLDGFIRSFVSRGDDFFKFNQHKLTSNGEAFDTFLRKCVHPELCIRNHVEGQQMNDMVLIFKPERNEYIGTDIYIQNKHIPDEELVNTKIAERGHRIQLPSIPKYYVKDGDQVDLPHMNIIQLLKLICGVNSIEDIETPGYGKLTLLLVACRGTCGKPPSQVLSLMRQISHEGSTYSPQSSSE